MDVKNMMLSKSDIKEVYTPYDSFHLYKKKEQAILIYIIREVRTMITKGVESE